MLRTSKSTPVAGAVVAAAAGEGEGAVVPAPVAVAVAADSRRRLRVLLQPPGLVPRPPGQVPQRLGPALQPLALGPRRVRVPLGARPLLDRRPVMSRGVPVPPLGR